MSKIYYIPQDEEQKDLLQLDSIMQEKRASERLIVLLLGSGGRESAMAWRIATSPEVEQLYIAPGNGGSEIYGINVPELSCKDFDAIADFIASHGVNHLVSGPEEPSWRGAKTLAKPLCNATASQRQVTAPLQPTKRAKP